MCSFQDILSLRHLIKYSGGAIKKAFSCVALKRKIVVAHIVLGFIDIQL